MLIIIPRRAFYLLSMNAFNYCFLYIFKFERAAIY